MLRWINPTPPDPVYEKFLAQSAQYLEPCTALDRLENAANTSDGIPGWETVVDNCHLQLDLFPEEAVAVLDLLGVSAPPSWNRTAAEIEADHLAAVLRYLGLWFDAAFRDESQWLLVASMWRFLRMNEPNLEERLDAWVEESVRRNPDAASRVRSLLLAARAQAHWLAGRKESARVLNERARAAADETSLPWVWKGLYDVADGRIDEARRAFSKALQIEPGRADARTYLDRLAEFAGGVTAAEGNRATAAP